MLCVQGPENEQDDPSSNERATTDLVESSEINIACYDEESRDTAATEAAVIDQGGPPTNKKRKAEQTANVEKRMDETYTLLNKLLTNRK